MNARTVVDVGDRVAACLLGGAIGDALGAGIEFSSIEEITRVHGPDGVTDYVEAYGRRGAITDDTQMTLFTTEGIIRAAVRQRSRGICHTAGVVRHAYIRWFLSQGERWNDDDFTAAGGADGWLIDVEGLHRRRAPGNTCLGAMAKGGHGTIDRPINDSKGCGGVMRAAPAGFVAADARFGLGCEIAALTHGHPSGYLPAGFLAATVGALLDGDSLGAALDTAERQLVEWRAHDETLAAVRAGRRLGESGRPVSPQDLEQLGGGWTGEEALAISIACAVSADSFEVGVLRAVNHSGDSDSTGSITGNLLGAALGSRALPQAWLDELELRDVIEVLAADATLELFGDPPMDAYGDGTPPADWWNRYPGW